MGPAPAGQVLRAAARLRAFPSGYLEFGTKLNSKVHCKKIYALVTKNVACASLRMHRAAEPPLDAAEQSGLPPHNPLPRPLPSPPAPTVDPPSTHPCNATPPAFAVPGLPTDRPNNPPNHPTSSAARRASLPAPDHAIPDPCLRIAGR